MTVKTRVTLNVQFPDDMISSLRAYAERDERPVGFLIRTAVANYLDTRRAAEQRERENGIAARMVQPAASPMR